MGLSEGIPGPGESFFFPSFLVIHSKIGFFVPAFSLSRLECSFAYCSATVNL